MHISGVHWQKPETHVPVPSVFGHGPSPGAFSPHGWPQPPIVPLQSQTKLVVQTDPSKQPTPAPDTVAHGPPQKPALPEPPAQVPKLPLKAPRHSPVVQSELTRQCCPG
jgi:hypothetical protein